MMPVWRSLRVMLPVVPIVCLSVPAQGHAWQRLKPMATVFTAASANGLPALPQGWRYVGVPHLPDATGEAQPKHDESKAGIGSVMSNLRQPGAHAIWLPLASGVALAGVRAGHQVMVLIDGRHAFDVSALRGIPAFADLTVDVGDDLTRLTFSAPPDARVLLEAQPGGWKIDMPGPSQKLQNPVDLTPRMLGNNVLLPTAFAGRVVADKDPVSGRRLLLGLVNGGTLVGNPRRAVGFALEQTLAGVVVAADTDQIAMRATFSGFLISAPGAPQFPIHIAEHGGEQEQSQVFGAAFASLDDRHALREMARRSRLQAALAAPGSRSRMRQSAARDALALGDVGAARGILDTMISDNPREAAEPNVALMRLIVQALSPRASETEGGQSTEMAAGGGREANFWRALVAAHRAAAMREASSAEIVQPIAAGIADLRSYPKPLRMQALALADEILARSDMAVDADFAARELSHANATWIDLLTRHGDQPADRAALSTMAHDRDPVMAAKAQEVMIDRDYRAGRLSPAQAAERYGMMRLGARLAEREGIVEGKELACEIAAGRWHDAAALLTAQHSQSVLAPQILASQSVSLLEGVVNDPALVSGEPARSLALIGLVLPHLDTLPTADLRLAARLRVARRLGQVGLEAKALSVLTADSLNNPTGDIPAELALLRGRLSLDLGRTNEAHAMLAAVEGLDLPQARRDERAVLAARIALIDGNPQAAYTALQATSVLGSERVRADACEALHNWGCAAHALSAVLGDQIASARMLAPDEQASVLRMGGDLARAGDGTGLTRLRAAVGSRMTDPSVAPTFAVLMHPSTPEAPPVTQ